MEEQSAGKEGHQDIAAADHRDDRDHRTGESKGIKINPIRHAEEDGDKDNVPVPNKRRRAFPSRIPEEQEDRQHHQTLVDIEPYLHRHHIQASHQMFVIQTARRSGKDGQNGKENPFIMRETDSLFFPGRGKEVERGNGKNHPDPLVQVQSLTEDKHGSNQRHDWLRSLDGPGNGQRQMLQGEIAEYPRRQNDHSFYKHSYMCLKGDTRHIQHRPVEHIRKERQKNEMDEDKTAYQCIEKQNRNNSIAIQRNLFIYFITT